MKINFLQVSITALFILGSCSKSGPSNPSTPTPTATVPLMGSTTAASIITSTNAKSGGTINSDGGAPVIVKGVCWSTSTNPTIANNKTMDGSGTGQGPTSFPSLITGLNPATTYYVRAYATNSIGTAYGNEINFITSAAAILPTVATVDINLITNSTAASGGAISTDGGSPVTARGVCWSTLPNPTTANSKTNDGTGSGGFVSNLTGLAEKTVYYVRAYATNSVGTAYGNEFSFKTIEAGTVFIGCGNNKFYALNALTGQKKWEYTGPTSFSFVDPCFANGKVYTGGGLDGFFYCLDTSNGNMLWRYQVGVGVSSAPVYDNGTVYFGGSDYYLYALDANTGSLKWRYLTGGNVSSPVVQNNAVYFGSDDRKMYALNASTGTFIWSYQTGALFNASGAAFANGKLYFGNRDGTLYALNANNGTLAWDYQIGISLEMSSPTVANNIVYIGGYRNNPSSPLKGSLYAINATTGAPVWESYQNTGFNSSPVIDNGKLFITTEDGDLLAVNAATGLPIWSKTVYSNGASPVVINDVVYVGGGGTNYIYAIDVATSLDRWRFPITNSSLTSGPCVVTATSVKHSGDSGMQQ